MQNSSELLRAYKLAENWLFVEALPFWARSGVDMRSGGFFEKIGQDGIAITDVPRRTRVVARQIYSFAAAGRLGWQGDWRALVDHGAEALFDHCFVDNGLVLSTYGAKGTPVNTNYDFYDHAFALFALAELAAIPDYHEQANQHAERMLDAMEERFRHPEAGFVEDLSCRMPLRANPHMHLLEACLAYSKSPGASNRWADCADGVVNLAMEKFIDHESGALREFFDYQWNPMSDDSGRLVEPGHQFEWSWLLNLWNENACDKAVERAATRLCEIGETHGVSSDGLTIDELWDSFTIRTATARTWPQTERIKSCVQYAARAGDVEGRLSWEQKAQAGLEALMRFTETDIPGLWHDRLDAEAKPILAPSPASSLYHIICAIETCHSYLALQHKLTH